MHISLLKYFLYNYAKTYKYCSTKYKLEIWRHLSAYVCVSNW